MWANGEQPNQWWPMSYGFPNPNPTQDASADWAAKAAMWAQQRMAQEEMAKQHQQYYATMQTAPPPLPTEAVPDGPPGEHPDLPPPPGESFEAVKPKPVSDTVAMTTDNLETVAMEDDPPEEDTPVEPSVTRLDYNHGQPVIPEVGPPPPLPGMQTFDHNHGYTPAPAVQPYGHMPAQRFDYGHQSGSQWYDYSAYHGEYMAMEQPLPVHHKEMKAERPQMPSAMDFSSMSGEYVMFKMTM
ncbi:predicted protein [Nematostella vectensis]|uniref:Uncharacterized protein n=1 Tax=Nematostella vectensis TaxID=45351 RepID=A7S2R7_NEMVE|nr:predicted protein [Nematostella vectensis]|eukprot:XP_001634034.1 predicted protein [Nematostella vectensis]